MRTKLTQKEVRAIALDGGEGWLVLADLAHEYGNKELALAAANSFDGTTGTNLAAIRSLHLEGARTVAVRAARRALERERSAGREPDKRSWAAVEAVEAGARGEDIVDVRDAAYRADSSSGAAYAAYAAADAAASSAYYTADAAATAAYYAAGRVDDPTASYSKEEFTLQLVDIFEVWWESVWSH